MSDRAELEELRRLDELERKAAGSGSAPEAKGNGGAVTAPAIPTLEETLGPSDFTKSFASTPFRMVKSAMQMVGAGDHVPAIVNELASEGDKSLPGRIVGDVAGTGGIRAGAGRLAQSLQALNAAKGVLPAIGRTAEAATYGGAQGAITSPDDQASAAKMGAAGGAAGQVIGRVVGGVVKPTAAARTLMDEGITLTPGQAAGKGSPLGKVEEWAASNPVASLAVNPARQRAAKEFNLAVVNDALKGVEGHPIPTGTNPREAVEAASDFISNQYDRSLGQIKASPRDLHQYMTHVLARGAEENPMIHPKDLKAVERYLSQRIAPLAVPDANGVLTKLTGEQLKQIDTEVGQYARQLARSSNAADRVAAPVWYELQTGIRQVMENGAIGTDAYPALQAANTAYRKLLPMRKAVATADVPTPRALRQAMLRHNQPPSELVQAAEQTLPGTVPNSGTAERLIASSLPALLLGGGAGAQGMGWDTVGSGMMAAGALGTRTGARAMTGSLPGQRMMAEALRRFTPATARGITRND